MRNNALGAVLVACHITSAVAFPSRGLNVRQDDSYTDPQNEDEWCGGSSDLREWDVTETTFHLVRPDRMVQIMAERGEDSWLTELERLAFEDMGRSRASTIGCSDLYNDDCDPGDGAECSEYFERNWQSKHAYWTFELVKRMHSKIKRLHGNLNTETLAASLSLASIAEDFDQIGESELPGGVATVLTTALSLASTAAGVVPGGAAYGAGFSVLSTIIGAIPTDDSEEGISVAAVSEALGEVFTSWTEGLERMVSLAFGNAAEGSFDDLPDVSVGGVTNMEHPITHFFGNPFWLLDDDSAIVNDFTDQLGRNIQQKLIDIIVQVGGWTVTQTRLGGSNPGESECLETKNRAWLNVDGEDYCWSMWNADLEDEEVGDVMKAHGIEDLTEYMQIAIDCARNGGSGEHEPDPEDILDFGSGKPRCFYSPPVVKTEPTSANVECEPGSQFPCSNMVPFFE